MPDPLLEFDPVSEDAANSPLSVWNTASYMVTEFNPDAANQTVQWASSVDTEGALPASVKDENRTISMTIECLSAAALRSLQAKVAKISRERGTLKWTLPNSEVIIFDLLARETFRPAFDYKYFVHSGAYCTVEMAFTALPAGRGAEVDLGDNTETTLPWLIFTETTVAGDLPALGRLVVDNDEAGVTQRWLGWGIQSRHYSSASTAALFYQAESCALFGGVATAAGPAGASGAGSNVVRNTALTTARTGQFYVGTSSTAQTHVGTYRVFTRVYAAATNTGTVSVGLSWTPFAQGRVVENSEVPVATDPALPGGGALEGQWATLDLGLISIPKAKKGSQGWIGYVAARSTVAGDDIDFDWVALVPVDEGYGEARTVDYAGSALAAGASGISVEVRHDDVLSQNAAGTYWTRPDVYEGDYLLVPPSGAEARTLRVIVRYGRHFPLNSNEYASPDIVTTFPDVTSDVSARLFVTPRYLVVPSP